MGYIANGLQKITFIQSVILLNVVAPFKLLLSDFKIKNFIFFLQKQYKY